MTASSEPPELRSESDDLPDFAAMDPGGISAAVKAMLSQQMITLEALEQVEQPDRAWVAAMERVQDDIQRAWGPVTHLNSVMSSPALRSAYNECLPLITDFQTALGQNEELYRRFEFLEAAGSAEDEALAELIRQTMRDFRLAGVALPKDRKAQFREVMQTLSSLQARFEQHLMDATDAFAHDVSDVAELAGLPAPVVERARVAAEEEGRTGWLLKLDPPTFQAVITHADSEALRRLYYSAWVTRASENGVNPEEWDNSSLIEQILEQRARAAGLLGFENFAALSLATKMADSAPHVTEFLEDLARRSREAAEGERDELTDFAGRELQAWDVGYFAEKLKKQRFAISDELLRAYFPLPRVLHGLFELAGRLFGLRFFEQAIESLWHPSARYFRIESADGQSIGGLLTDLYARPNKRGGAWMDGCRDRARLDGLSQDPVAYLICNFAPPVAEAPAWLTHHDVQTLFHEFGHALHHLLTEIDYPSVAGINGVAWDAVELPSQFLENYAWLPNVLTQISAHKDTGDPLPAELIDTLIASRSFLAALAMMRQLEFALFDFRLHTETVPPSGGRIQKILDQTRAEVSIWPVPPFNRFQCSFGHIFGGGYAAGYYSYKWAEVLAADAFSAFEEDGAFDGATAERFRRSVLAVGGSRPAMQAFIDFRGREPELGPLLRQTGIT